MKKYNVLSLFDGISCAKAALERADIPVDNYFASEIENHSITIAQKNFPDITQLGDICNINASELPHIDLIIGGSPCTNLSAAGDRTGLDGSESKLFYEFIRLLEEVKPTHFILENVASMTDRNKDLMSNIIGTEPIMIDAGRVSAQIRRRYFWCNFRVTQPEYNYQVLSDVLVPRIEAEDITDRMMKKSPGTLAYVNAWKFVRYPNQKARTLMAGGQGISNTGATNIQVGDRYYKPSPVECERLMGLPDDYTAGIPITARYKSLGNAFSVDVVSHILCEMLKNEDKSEQMKLF